MKSICVYLGAKPGNSELFQEKTIELGKEIALNGFNLVYGGSSTGLMGVLAQTVKAYGGTVTGIIPKNLLSDERKSHDLDKFILTETMQERKLLLQKLSDAFVVMPGGIGTLEEAFETWNAIKIGSIQKPIGFLNVGKFFESLFTFVEHCHESGFISKEQLGIPLMASEPHKLISVIKSKLMIENEIVL